MSAKAEIFSNHSVPAGFLRSSVELDLLGNIISCLLGILAFVEFRIVGRLFLTEILLFCMLPFLLTTRGGMLLAPLPRRLLLLGSAWLTSQVVTDIIRDSPFEDWSRGWSKIIFLLLNFSAIYLFLNGRQNRFLLFAIGIALGQIMSFFFNPSEFAADYPWKFGYGQAVTLLAVIASQLWIFKRSRFSSSALLIVMGALNFYTGFRSYGLICLLTAVFVMAKQSNRFNGKRMKRGKFLVLVLLIGIALYGTSALYNYAADEGWLGTVERDKYLAQSAGELGVLLGGRTESFGSTQAVIDSPIIGHGSWAKDWKYVDMWRDALKDRGYQDPGELETNLIPSHSYIMGAWVESGFVGAFFWLWALVLTARSLRAAFEINSVLSPLIAFVAFSLLWNILFSPFGAEGRLYVAYNLVLIMFVLSLQRYSIEIKA